MTHQRLSWDDLLAAEFLTVEGIELFPEQIAQALDLSQRVDGPNHQWQTYLNALALFGFTEWLAERAPELGAVDTRACSLFQSPTTERDCIVTGLQMGVFKLSLITTEAVIEPVIHLPVSILDRPATCAHFYILIEVIEDQEMVRIEGFLRYDQLLGLRPTDRSSTAAPLCLTIPRQLVHSDLDTLLLNLRYLDAAEIGRPEVESLKPSVLHRQSSTPDLDRLINVATWLQDCLDTVAQELSWILLPIFTTEPAPMRTASEDAEDVLMTLAAQQITVPPSARGAYRELLVGHHSLRLYTWVRELPHSTGESEWLLLLVLAPKSGHTLPSGIQLQIRDQRQLLLEKFSTEADSNSYIYAQLLGDDQEQFEVTIVDAQGDIIYSSRFIFNQTP